MKLKDIEGPITICEIGCNHKGDMDIAHEMIKVAAEFCGADVVKFQKRDNKLLLSEEEYNTPHPVPHNSYGDTYGAHREYLELDLDQHRQLKTWCEDFGVVYSSSVWDMGSTQDVIDVQPELIKVPSAINTNQQVLDKLYRDYEGEIHISLGMTTREEEETVVAMAEKHGRGKDLVLYHCISGYPVETEDLYLLEIPRLIETYGERVKAIGFSGHHKGIAADIAALALGATQFERHFTLDRTWKGTDHAASLEPDGFRRLSRDLKSVNNALRVKTDMIPDELVQRDKLKKFVSLDD